jgi:hypothetical protein
MPATPETSNKAAAAGTLEFFGSSLATPPTAGGQPAARTNRHSGHISLMSHASPSVDVPLSTL